MRGIRVFFRLIVLAIGVAALSCALAMPVIALALFFSPRAALGIVVFLSAVPLGSLLILSEWGIVRIFRGQTPRTLGLRNSYEAAAACLGKRPKARPALLTFSDPVPNVFAVRALGGDGLILLSDGLISLLDESELRFVLARAIQHLGTGEAVLQSTCIFGVALLQNQRLSAASASLRDLSPIQALRELMLYPWFRFFSVLARRLVTRRVAPRREEPAAAALDFVRGGSKLSRAGRLYGQQTLLPGLVYLGIEG